MAESPAEEAGIRRGERILAVGACSATADSVELEVVT